MRKKPLRHQKEHRRLIVADLRLLFLRPVECLGITLQDLTEIVEEVVEGYYIIIGEVYADEQYAHIVQHVDYLAL